MLHRLAHALRGHPLFRLPFWRFVIARTGEDRLIPVAAELTFITLLSLTPLAAVGLSLINAFPVFRDALTSLQEFLFTHYVPPAASDIRDHVLDFAERASRMTWAGLAILLTTVLAGMFTIEGEINQIWRIERRRAIVPRVLLYWAVVTVGPVLVGAGLLLTSYVASLTLMNERLAPTGIGALWFFILPPLFTFLALALVYITVPNRRVPRSSAFLAALLGALLFEGAKRGFGLYLRQFSVYESLYGTFAALPAILIWIYLSWLIVLAGAELSACLASWHPHAGRERAGGDLDSAVRLLGELRRMQRQGMLLSLEERGAELFPGMPWVLAERLADALGRAGIVHRSEEGDLALSRPLDEVSLREVQRALRAPLPEAEWISGDNRLRRAVERARARLDEALSVSVEEVVGEEPATSEARHGQAQPGPRARRARPSDQLDGGGR